MIEARHSDGRRQRVTFEWQQDRFRHTISLVSLDARSLPLFESIEGAASEDWPPSPPLQSLTIEDRSTGPVALLVGMAGGSHWSASIEATSEGELRFDFACRHAQAPRWLGNSYRRLSQLHTLDTFGSVTAHLVWEATSGANLLTVTPTSAGKSAGTTRWAYSLRLADTD